VLSCGRLKAANDAYVPTLGKGERRRGGASLIGRCRPEHDPQNWDVAAAGHWPDIWPPLIPYPSELVPSPRAAKPNRMERKRNIKLDTGGSRLSVSSRIGE